MISNIILIQSLVSFSAGAIGGIIVIVTWLYFFYRRERRIYKNIRRPICVIGTEDKPMEHESKLLKDVGFFNIERLSDDKRSIDVISKHRVVVLGYSPNSDFFWQVFETAKARLIPIIVFASVDQIDPKDAVVIQDYSYVTICNTPIRLISDVYSLMCTYPEA